MASESDLPQEVFDIAYRASRYTARKLGLQEADADEILARVLVIYVVYLCKRSDSVKNLKAYIYTTAWHVGLKLREQRDRRRAVSTDAPVDPCGTLYLIDLLTGGDDPAEVVMIRDLIETFERRLSESQLQVWRHHKSGTSYAEISKATGRSVPAVTLAVFRLRRQFAEFCEAQ